MIATLSAKLNRTKIGVKVTALLVIGTVSSEEVTIYRDGWGVPHIYGDTDRAVAFGYGYAQAQDRLDALLENYATSNGRLAARIGPDGVTSDFQQRLWGHREAAERELAQAPDPVRQWADAFAAGINHFIATQPTVRNSIQPYEVFGLARHIFWRGILRQLDAEYRREQIAEVPPAVGTLVGLAPERTTLDAAALIADPYDSWDSTYRWYEAHLHGPGIHLWGMTYPGLALPVYGHNRTIGWGWLPKGPDTGDVYRVVFESAGAIRYRWNGRTRTADVQPYRIEVRENEPRSIVGLRTHLGPIIHRQGAIGHAYRVPDLGAGQLTQLYGMFRASTLKSFYEAIRPGQLGPATFLFADRSGTLFYIQAGHVPIRSESVDWYRPVSDEVSSDWLGVHVQEDLVQTVDPRPGWIVDADTSPDLVTRFAPLTPDRFPDHIFNNEPGRQSLRSTRIQELVRQPLRLSRNEILNIPVDTYVIGSGRWLRALAVATGRLTPKWTESERSAYEALMSWNHHADVETHGPAFYVSWREAAAKAGRSIDVRSIELGTRMSDQTTRHLIDAFRTAVVSHKARCGHMDVRWKEVHRMKRLDRSWALPSINLAGAVSVRRIDTQLQNVVRYGRGGQSTPTVMLLNPTGIQSYSALPYGQSDDSQSPHHWDQAEVLFSQGKLKPTRFDTRPADLKKKEVLRLPEDLILTPKNQSF